MHKHIAQWNPTMQLWEGEQMDLFSEQLEPYSVTWPTSGMTRSGSLFPLPASVPHTSDSGFSSSLLLPTPTTQPNTGNGHARDLGSEIRMLPTPRAADGHASMTAPAARQHVASGMGSLAEVLGAHLNP